MRRISSLNYWDFLSIPFTKVSDVEVKPYITTLSIHLLVDSTDEVQVIDNEILYNKFKNPAGGGLNHLIYAVMPMCNLLLNIHRPIKWWFKKISRRLSSIYQTSLLYHWFGSFNFRRISMIYRALTVLELTQQIFDAKYMVCVSD